MEGMPKRHLEASTPTERAKMRKELGTLKSLTVQPLTRSRYVKAREAFYDCLKEEHIALPSSSYQLDLVVSDYLEALWALGKGRSEGSNILAGLQDAQPHLKGKLKMSWRLMKPWATHEVPNRAPPIPLDCLHVLLGYALFKKLDLFALSLMLGFHGLLRTGELLGLQAKHISVQKAKGPAVISLGLTKSGKRQGSAESITIHSEDVCRRLFQWKHTVTSETSLCGPSHKWRKTFNDVLEAVGFDQFDFRPYSLRRGGATHLFQLHGRFDALMVLGRWQAASTARIYINSGLAVLAEISLPKNRFINNLRSQYLSSLTKPLAQLELTKKPSQRRGRWKRAQKSFSRRTG
jgi:integrase